MAGKVATRISVDVQDNVTNALNKIRLSTENFNRQMEKSFDDLRKKAGASTADLARIQQEAGYGGGALRSAMGGLNIRSSAAIAAEMKTVVQNYRFVRDAAGSTAQDVQRANDGMRASLKKLAQEAKGVSPAIGKAEKSFSLFSKTVGAFAALGVGSMLLDFGKEAFEAMLKLDKLQTAYASIEGGEAGGKNRLDALLATSRELGLEFQSTAEAAKGFFAAAQGTSLAKEAQSIFEGVAKAGTALNMSTDDLQGAFRALGQMVSKGKVQAEELRGQLGERLPGAFQLAAKAMGMTTAELDKFMEDGKLTAEDLLPKLAKALEEQFGQAAINAAGGAQQAFNRMRTEWELLKASFLNSDAVAATLNTIAGLFRGINKAQAEKKDFEELTAYLEKKGVKKLGTAEFFVDMHVGSETRNVYTEQQLLQAKFERDFEADQKKHFKEHAIAQEKLYIDMSKAITESLKGTADYEVAQLKRIKKERLAAIDAGIDAMRRAGEKAEVIASAQAERAKVEAVLDAQIEKAANKGQKKNSSAARQQLKYDKSDLGLDVLRQEISAFEEALNPALDKYSAMLARIEAERKTAIAKAQADAQKLLLDKKATPEQAAEFENLKVQKAELEAQKKMQDLQNQNLRDRADFYKELAEKTGEYGVSLEYQTQLLEKQRELWIGMGIPVQDVTEMMRLQREELEETVALNERFAAINSRTKELMQDKYYDKPLAGIELSFLDSARDAFAFRDQMRDSFTSMFGTIADAGTSAFQTIFTGGTFEANKFFANLTAQLAAQAASAAGNTLIKGIFGLLGNALMSGFTGALGQNMFTGTAPLMPIPGGSSWSSPIAGMHDGGVVGRDATFTRAMPLSLWAQAPRYHTGGMAGFRPDELPIIAQRGETILSRADSGGIGAKLDAIVSLLSAQRVTQSTAGGGNTNVVLVDDQRKVKNYLLSPEGGRTFVTMLNNNRQSIQNIANGGRA